jgi:hypothetical protein
MIGAADTSVGARNGYLDFKAFGQDKGSGNYRDRTSGFL